MIFVAGITLSFFLTLLLLTKRSKEYADYLLAGWFLASGIHQMLFYFDQISFIASHPFFAGVILPFPFIHGPFLYLYTSAKVEGKKNRRWMDLLHFIPFVAVFIYLIPFFLLPAERRLYIMSHRGEGAEVFVALKFWAIVASGLIYIGLSLRLLYAWQRTIVNRFSNLERVNLQWLLYLIYGVSIIWLVIIFLPEIYVFIASVLFVGIAGFFGLRHAGIFTSLPVTEKPNLEAEEPGKVSVRYEKSGLTPDRKAKLSADLSRLMSDKKPYLNPDLTLDTLASQLDIGQNQLSQVINEELQTTFYDYVNTYRVKEFERLAAEPDSRKFTLLALAYNSGFNSKASFNRYFKKVTGKSPSAYVREAQ